MTEEARGIPGVQVANKVAGMAARARNFDARAHAANSTATPPDIKTGMVSSQQA